LRLGIIGAGVVGQLRAEAARRAGKVVVAGIADVDGARARLVAGTVGAEVFTDYRRLLDTKIDGVLVCTPVPLHEQTVVAALEAGKHVLCEKPLASSVPACRRILAAAAAAGRKLAVGFNHRYYPSVKYLKRVIDEGVIGPLDHLRVFGGHEGLGQFRADWMYRGELSGGGAMMDLGLHVTDLVRFLVGDIREVYAATTNGVWRVEGSEDNALVLMKSADGVPVTYQATWSEWRGYRLWLEAYGLLGMARAQYAPTFNLVITQAAPGARRRRALKLHVSTNVGEKLFGWQRTARAAFAEELTDFASLIEGRPVPLADGLAGLRAVEIAHAAYESSRRGERVLLSTAAGSADAPSGPPSVP
jgi:predicted dehydrogenase